MNKYKSIVIIGSVIAALSLTGCVKKYDTPEYVEVSPNETAFVVPLEGNGANQAKFGSEEYLEKSKVATRRIQIPHRWNQTGRWEREGDWITTIRVIKVNRAPVTREWETNGTLKDKNKDTGIWVESADSIGFSTGFSVTAYIEEGNTARFLYSYVNNSLSGVMDSEVRARIQMIAAEVSAKYTMDDLRGRKSEIIEAIKADIIPFFEKKGITITTIGMFGGFSYENPKIQDSIDQTFVVQQEKVRAKAELDAQADKNTRIKSEATAVAEAARLKANGEAEGKKLIFAAEADGIRSVNKALAEANDNPMLIELKKIEVDKVRAEKWNGSVPQWVTSDNMPMMFNVTPPVNK